jgi:hypothetical protein
MTLALLQEKGVDVKNNLLDKSQSLTMKLLEDFMSLSLAAHLCVPAARLVSTSHS